MRNNYINGMKLHNYENFEEKPLSKIWIIGTNLKDIPTNPNKNKYNIYIANQHHYRENIDNLNRMWCEYCGMYYVWKNNLRSDFVGFCHYRRLIDVEEDERKLIKEHNSIMYFSFFKSDKKDFTGDYAWIEKKANKFSCPPFVIKDVIDYLNTQNYVSSETLKNICNQEEFVPFYNREIFYTTWDNFCKIMEFLNGYFEYITKKYNIQKLDDWKEHVSKYIIKYYKYLYFQIEKGERTTYKSKFVYQRQVDMERIFSNDEGFSQYCNCWRVYAYITELLVSLWIASHPISKPKKLYEFKDEIKS